VVQPTRRPPTVPARRRMPAPSTRVARAQGAANVQPAEQH
jgi:hypothetical protein